MWSHNCEHFRAWHSGKKKKTCTYYSYHITPLLFSAVKFCYKNHMTTSYTITGYMHITSVTFVTCVVTPSLTTSCSIKISPTFKAVKLCFKESHTTVCPESIIIHAKILGSQPLVEKKIFKMILLFTGMATILVMWSESHEKKSFSPVNRDSGRDLV